jgi:hypothetical protein
MTSTEEKLMQLNRKVVQLFQEEKYSEAIKLGLQALEMGKTKLGSRHPNTATAINNLRSSSGISLKTSYLSKIPIS